MNLGGQGGKAIAAGRVGRAATTKNVRRETERWIRLNKVAAVEAKTGDDDAEVAAEAKMLAFLKTTLTVGVVDAMALDDDAQIPELISIADLVPKRPDCCAAWCCAGAAACKKSVGPQPKDIKGHVSDLAFMGILALFNSGAGQDKLDVPTLLNISKRLEDVDGDVTYGKVTPTAAGDPIRGYFVSFTIGPLLLSFCFCSSVVLFAQHAPFFFFFFFFALAIAVLTTMIADLNAVGPLISMFFMMTYGLVNFAVFVLDTSRSPAWRPGFIFGCDCMDKLRWGVALFGAIVCLTLMILIDQTYAIVALIIGAAVYFLIDMKTKCVTRVCVLDPPPRSLCCCCYYI
jgi:hypothetical protein